MAKGYWICFYDEINEPAKLMAYAKLAAPAIEAGGGQFLARDKAVGAFEDGMLERTVVIEFESAEKAIATYHSAAYQEAHAALQGGVVRGIRIVRGV